MGVARDPAASRRGVRGVLLWPHGRAQAEVQTLANCSGERPNGKRAPTGTPILFPLMSSIWTPTPTAARRADSKPCRLLMRFQTPVQHPEVGALLTLATCFGLGGSVSNWKIFKKISVIIRRKRRPLPDTKERLQPSKKTSNLHFWSEAAD